MVEGGSRAKKKGKKKRKKDLVSGKVRIGEKERWKGGRNGRKKGGEKNRREINIYAHKKSTDTQTDRPPPPHTHRQTNRQTFRERDKQTYIHTFRQTDCEGNYQLSGRTTGALLPSARILPFEAVQLPSRSEPPASLPLLVRLTPFDASVD